MKVESKKTIKIELDHGELFEMIMDYMSGEVDFEDWEQEDLTLKFYVTKKHGDESVDIRTVVVGNQEISKEDDKKEDPSELLVEMTEVASQLKVPGYAGEPPPPSEFPFHLEPRARGEGLPEPKE